MIKQQLERMDSIFVLELKDVSLTREKRGMTPVSIRRLTKAIINSSVWPDLKQKLINADIKEDRRNGNE